MRAFWTGEMVFGLVTIPVKLYTATKDLSPQFHQLHIACGSRVGMVRRCNKCEKDLEWAEIGKGHEVEKDKYVLFTKEELSKLEGNDDKGTIEIVQFIDPSEIDGSTIDKSYWIGPGGKSAKSARGYELLRSVLEETKHAAVIKVKFRTRPRLGIVQAKGKFFVLHSLRFADELVSASELTAPDVKPITDRERAMAKTLVEELVAPFDYAEHPDQYREAVLAAVDAKVAAGEGVESTAAAAGPNEEASGVVVDLADLLAASIKGKKEPQRLVKLDRGKKSKAGGE